MSAIAATYLSGYLGSVSVDGVAVPVNQWSGTHEVGVLDYTNSTSAGAQNVERGIEKLSGTATAVWKAVSGAPSFAVGSKYAILLKATSGVQYSFNGLIKSVAPKNDTKGTMTFDLAFESDGAITPPTN